MTNLTNQTISVLKARLNKGQRLLNEDSKKAFNLAIAAYCNEVGRTVAKFRKQDFEHALSLMISCYRAQECSDAETSFHNKTRTAKEQGAHVVRTVKQRAAIIREAMAEAKKRAMASGKAVKVTLPKITFE